MSSIKVGTTVSIVAQAYDPDLKDTLSGKLTLTTPSKGMIPLIFNPRSKGNGNWEAVNTYKPTVAGKYDFKIEISDSFGNKVDTRSSFTAIAKNNLPIITTTSLPSCSSKKYYTAKVQGSDQDISDTLKMTASGLPKGLTFGKCLKKDSGGKVETNVIECPITGIPTTKGKYDIKVSLTDGKDFATKTLTLNCL